MASQVLNKWNPSRLRRSSTIITVTLLSLAMPFSVKADGHSSSPVTVESQSVQSTAIDLLVKMSESFKSLNYKGVFSYEHGPSLDSLRIIHRVQNEIETERLYHLDGKPREIIRKGHLLHCIHPGDKIIRQNHHQPASVLGAALPEDLTGLSENYRFIVKKGERIADRSAVRVVVKPKDLYRYGYSFWLDEETGLLLKSLMFSSENRVLERFQFAHVEVGVEISDEELSPRSENYHLADHHDISRNNNKLPEKGIGVRAGWVPEGFTQATEDQQGPDDKTAETNTLMYTDGLAAFTVFVELLKTKGVPSGFTQNGGTIAYAKTYVKASDTGPNDDQAAEQYLVTIVGEVPMKTAERVANAIELIN